MMKCLLTVFLACFVFIGCGGGNPQGRVGIRGVVTLDEQPLRQGSVEFNSEPGALPVVQAGAMIKDGNFRMPPAHGLVPEREYSVRIRSMEAIPGKQNEPADSLEATVLVRDIVPPEFGIDSRQKVRVTKKGPNEFRFDMKRNNKINNVE